MKRILLLAAGLLLLLLVVALNPRGGIGFTRSSETATKSAKSDQGGTLAGGRARPRHARERSVTREQAFQRLRDLLSAPADGNLQFEEVEDLARRLSTDQLQALVREVVFVMTGSPAGWVHCAGFAELGRREPEATLDRLLAQYLEHGVWLMDNPALFSIFRGWAEVDPQAAAQRLATTHTLRAQFGTGFAQTVPGTPLAYEGWKAVAYVEVFAAFARRDLEEAREAFALDGVQQYSSKAWEGIFRELRGANEVVPQFLRYDVDGRWKELEVKDTSVEVVSRNGARERERVILAAAASLAKDDLAGALRFVKAESGREDGSDRAARDLPAVVQQQFAERYPDEALGLLREGKGNAHLAVGVAAAHPERLREILNLGGAELEPGQIIAAAIDAQVPNDFIETFPGPGRNVRLANPEESSRQFREVIAAARLSEQERQVLLTSLVKEFGDVLLEAPREANK